MFQRERRGLIVVVCTRDSCFKVFQFKNSCTRKVVLCCYSSSSGHEIRPRNDLFRRHDHIYLAISLRVVQVFFRQVSSQGVVLDIKVSHPANMI
jgi:hypothetical protein